MKFIHEVSTTVVYCSLFLSYLANLEAICKPSHNKKNILSVQFLFFLYCCCSSQIHFPFSWYFLSRIYFEILTMFYLSLKLKLLSNVSPKRQNLSTFWNPILKKKSGNESQAASWFGKPLDSGSAHQSRLCSWVESTLLACKWAQTTLLLSCCISGVWTQWCDFFWTTWSMRFTCVQDISAKSYLYVKSFLVS